MTKLFIDLNTRIIADEHRVFLTRPGKQSRLYDAFAEASVVGPELPSLRLEQGKEITDISKLQAQVTRSVAVRNWIKAGRNPKEKPGEDLNNFSRVKTLRSIGQHIATVRGYFETAKKHDIGVMYPHAYNKEVIVYEFTEEPIKKYLFEAREYSKNEELTVRKYKELVRIPKRKLPQHIIDIIQKPNSIVQLSFYDRIFFYNLAYGSYQFEDEFSSRIDIRSPEYNTYDDLVLKALMNYVSANYLALRDQSGSDLPPEAIPFRDAMLLNLGDDAPELSTSIHSPGFHRIRSSHLIPALVSVIVALAVNDETPMAQPPSK